MAIDLIQLRDEIDTIDQAIVDLYEKRIALCEEVAAYKIETGKAVFDKAREVQKIEKVRGLAQNDFNKMAVEELFEQIMAVSRKRQYQLLEEHGKLTKFDLVAVDELPVDDVRIAFQGALGSYSDEALVRFFGKEVDALAVESFSEAVQVVEAGTCDYAVLPIENSTAGIVSEIYDLLMEHNVSIVGEVILPINHCLLGVKGSKIEHINTVYSHQQSLMQSSRYLSEKNWKQVGLKNNAFAAMKVAEDQDLTAGAIASANAASIYGLEILEEGIQTLQENRTRFIVISNKKIYQKEAKKLSISFQLIHKSGSLYHVLSHFIFNKINMTKIESRPTGEKTWEYRFMIDIEGSLLDCSVQNALKGIEAEVDKFKILGNF